MRFHEGDLDVAARRINKHPGVSHNYARTGQFNLWFTVAVPPSETIEDTVDRMARDTGALAVRVMPTIRFFKIGVNFDMVREEGAATDYFSPDGLSDKINGKTDHTLWNRAEVVTEQDRRAIRELQEDLPLTGRPFADMARAAGFDGG